jgi:hypothetical protein
MKKNVEGYGFRHIKHTFSKDDFEAMANALKRENLSKKHRDSLQQLCDGFTFILAFWNSAPSSPKIRKQLTKLRKGSDRMLELLSAPYLGEQTDLPARRAAYTLMHDTNPETVSVMLGEDFEKLNMALKHFSIAAETAAARLPKGKGGRPNSFPLEKLIPKLQEVFFEITKVRGGISTHSYLKESEKGEFSGKFLDFAEAFLLPITDHRKMARRTLGSEIKRILRDRRQGKI